MKKTQGDGGLTIKYAALQGNYWMLFGSVFTFIAVFLLSRGFSAGGVGVLMALGNITGAVLQPWIAAVADKSEKYTLKQMMICITVLGIFRRQRWRSYRDPGIWQQGCSWWLWLW